jgi:FtsP/CotA-like multicopper oxidase with cupredoxin domain
MKAIRPCSLIFLLFLLFVGVQQAEADVFTQCPCPSGTPVNAQTGNIECTLAGPPTRNIACKSLTAGDGYVRMADGTDIYIFGFSDVTGIADSLIMQTGMLAANFAAPTIDIKQGQEFYLSLTNVGMTIRPDLFDPHTVHFHGFPHAATVFDGEPMASTAISMGSTITYYYNLAVEGTHLYHCHVEATEHMQMGMLGNLFVRSSQEGSLINGFTKFAYTDGDGSTGYDVGFPIQIHSFDPLFHAADELVQPLPFAAMKDVYPMLNGRGYPDTINPADIVNVNGLATQKLPSLITAAVGQRILLRISSIATVDFYTLTVPGIPMTVIGKDSRILRSSAGANLYYTTNSVTLGGGESIDVILDTAGIAPGTYFLYSTNLNNLSNNTEDFGGMMTEIVITL